MSQAGKPMIGGAGEPLFVHFADEGLGKGWRCQAAVVSSHLTLLGM
jgi:hypothetical protein